MAESTEDLKDEEGATDNGTDDTEGTEGEEEEEGTESEDDKSDKDDADFTPPVRNNPLTFIRQRIERRKIKELQSKEESEDDTDEGETQTHNREDDPSYLAAKIVLDEKDLNEYLEKNPSHKKYAAKARKFLQNPAYDQVPVSVIMRNLAYDDSQKEGAQKAGEANSRSKKNKLSASSGKRSGGEDPDAFEMSQKDFDAKVQSLRTRPRPRK